MKFGRRPMQISRVDAGSSTAFLVHTDVVNWILLQEGSDLTLIDGGYPGQASAVEESVRAIGRRPEDIRGAVLTHAHVDHLGGLVTLSARYGFDVYCDPVEVAHARREYLQQAGPADIVPISYRPRVLHWLSMVLPLGALSRTGLEAEPFPSPLDLPGAPNPVAAYGHTDGHSAYLVADDAVLVCGDAMVSGHPISTITGPQCIEHAFAHDEATARRTVESFTSLDATVLFPGHGPRHNGPVAEAARRALDIS
ncbi:MAG: MBL fold metallo-hydrolase [Gordonia sp.]|jgi:glyoxylase-like metal-dependent hydrolase (beta-lactamase superfamily II)|uniref:MBL fold metallo-hydrolase n=1 Tax=Gordonia sp. (in: high G+C Gram-positive bacteria) TaxID=84139 RepID=UPI000C580ED7|nr:MBL fold metallo-hydrolase [Gordonia sp. (in: high G+C Gram-positive bacteria)]MAU83801.1 MBL fold metallo-hydrolase [Gordonia sp. (in: high G+C Gram-positive bacteria)]